SVFEEAARRPRAAIEIPCLRLSGCGFGRQVHVAELLISTHCTPDAACAHMLPGAVRPRVVAEFAGARDYVERPPQRARAHVERADISRERDRKSTRLNSS